MVRSTGDPAWARLPARGGYIVQPDPALASNINDVSKSKNVGGIIQKHLVEEMLCWVLQLLTELSFWILQLW